MKYDLLMDFGALGMNAKGLELEKVLEEIRGWLTSEHSAVLTKLPKWQIVVTKHKEEK